MIMIVMKFGGTSLKDAESVKRVHSIVRERLDKNPVVVVSAVAGATDNLLSGARRVVAKEQTVADFAAPLMEQHRALLDSLALDSALLDGEFSELRKVLQGVYLIGELSPRTMDYVVSFGERLSAKIVAAYFTANGIDSLALNGWDAGFVTDGRHGCAEVLPESYENIKSSLSTSPLPVVTGFIAKSRKGEITTLGRGGSDYTAAIIGSALGAEEIQIWTDVDGVLTADPRVVESARLLESISFDEASELSYFGASVLHPKTIIPAVEKNIPVRVLNTYNPSSAGTAILSEAKNGRDFTAITFKRGITVVRICSTRMLLAHGFLAKIFEVFRDHEISVDLVSTSEVSVSMTLDNAENLDAAIKELEQYGTVEVTNGMAMVSLVSVTMAARVGVAGKIFSVCGDNGVPVRMISQGASRTNLSFVVGDSDLDKCVKVLHKELFE